MPSGSCQPLNTPIKVGSFVYNSKKIFLFPHFQSRVRVQKNTATRIEGSSPLCCSDASLRVKHNTTQDSPSLPESSKSLHPGRDRKRQKQRSNKYVYRGGRKCGEGLLISMSSATGILNTGDWSFVHYSASHITKSSIRVRWCYSGTNAYLEMGKCIESTMHRPALHISFEKQTIPEHVWTVSVHQYSLWKIWAKKKVYPPCLMTKTEFGLISSCSRKRKKKNQQESMEKKYRIKRTVCKRPRKKS